MCQEFEKTKKKYYSPSYAINLKYIIVSEYKQNNIKNMSYIIFYISESLLFPSFISFHEDCFLTL